MPTYEYSCRSCNQVFEVFQSMRDAPLSRCPNCGQPTVKRLIGRGAGIIFKGSGFYETDYKRPAGKDGASTDGAKLAAAEAKPAAPASAGGDGSSSSAGSSPAPAAAKKE